MSDDFLEKHKIFRRLALLWAMSLITYAVWVTFTDVSLITAAVVSALSLVVGLLATVIGFYMHSRFKDDRTP